VKNSRVKVTPVSVVAHGPLIIVIICVFRPRFVIEMLYPLSCTNFENIY
jgi:hypothetical protein